MKEWNNPQLFSLGVESTFKQDKNQHPCHSTGSGTHSGWHNGKGHTVNTKCPTGEHTDIYVDKFKGKYVCCCDEVSGS